MVDRELTGDEAQRALSEAMRRTMATVPDPTPAELIAFVKEERYESGAVDERSARMFSALLSVLEQGPSSLATGAGTDLMVKELHERANVCTRNAYQHRKEGQEMSAQFHLGAAMAFRDMADKLSSAPVPLPDAAPSPFDFRAHLQRQREFSERTFGPGARTAGVLDHIRKELCEIEAEPNDLREWIDVVILALDGAWRAGFDADEIIDTLVTKQARNEARKWPDWRTAPLDKAIEHIPASSASPAKERP